MRNERLTALNARLNARGDAHAHPPLAEWARSREDSRAHSGFRWRPSVRLPVEPHSERKGSTVEIAKSVTMLIASVAMAAPLAACSASSEAGSVAASSPDATPSPSGARALRLKGAAPGMEKCYGIAKPGMNDCASASHACAGQSTASNSPSDWRYAAKGTCTEAGGTLTPGGKR